MLKHNDRGKLLDLESAARLIDDGTVLALGGNVLHRSPSAFARELARQGRKNIEVVKTAGAYDIDLLCAAGVIKAVSAGFVGYENEFGLCPNYRKQVEAGMIEAKEHACYTVITALRAASYGVSFLPINGLQGSDVPEARGLLKVKDPYAETSYVAIPAINPDWAVLHVHEADTAGNARIIGQAFEDVLMTRAAKNVIITSERIVDSSKFEKTPELVSIPGFLVHGVVHVPKGAAPASCPGQYGYDSQEIKKFLSLTSRNDLEEYLLKTAVRDRKGIGKK
ncbi:MAG: CoA transferase subunit A [Bacillus sp. (in: Bacteria)]|nr:CoA transferase subunit A [Bacillus sp. (in: firmicutes)]